MPENEREALRAAVQAHKAAIQRMPLPWGVLEELEIADLVKRKGA